MECGSLAGPLAARAISNRRNPVEITLKIGNTRYVIGIQLWVISQLCWWQTRNRSMSSQRTNKRSKMKNKQSYIVTTISFADCFVIVI